MKKQIFLFVAAVCFSITSLMAQENTQRQTSAERTKATLEKMAPLNLDADAKTKTEAVIMEFYDAQQKVMGEMRASGGDREAMRAKRKELEDARDVKLKAIFTAEQQKKWQDEIEPTLRPQKPKN